MDRYVKQRVEAPPPLAPHLHHPCRQRVSPSCHDASQLGVWGHLWGEGRARQGVRVENATGKCDWETVGGELMLPAVTCRASSGKYPSAKDLGFGVTCVGVRAQPGMGCRRCYAGGADGGSKARVTQSSFESRGCEDVTSKHIGCGDGYDWKTAHSEMITPAVTSRAPGEVDFGGLWLPNDGLTAVCRLQVHAMWPLARGWCSTAYGTHGWLHSALQTAACLPNLFSTCHPQAHGALHF